MSRVVYKKIDGRAFDIRFEADSYGLKEHEYETNGTDELPTIVSLSDKEYLMKMKLAKLSGLDLKSIRSIREWIISQEGAPQYLIDYELEATENRNELKKLKEEPKN